MTKDKKPRFPRVGSDTNTISVKAGGRRHWPLPTKRMKELSDILCSPFKIESAPYMRNLFDQLPADRVTLQPRRADDIYPESAHNLWQPCPGRTLFSCTPGELPQLFQEAPFTLDIDADKKTAMRYSPVYPQVDYTLDLETLDPKGLTKMRLTPTGRLVKLEPQMQAFPSSEKQLMDYATFKIKTAFLAWSERAQEELNEDELQALETFKELIANGESVTYIEGKSVRGTYSLAGHPQNLPKSKQSDGAQTMNIDISALAKEIHAQNVSVGWWDDMNRCPYQTLELDITEVAEATEGERKDLMDTHLEHRKNGEVELADAMIRLMDMAGRYGWYFSRTYVESTSCPRTRVYYASRGIAGKHLAVNMGICKIAELMVENADVTHISYIYTEIINRILQIGEDQGYDVMTALREKFEYNKTRIDHTRAARAEKNGKRF